MARSTSALIGAALFVSTAWFPAQAGEYPPRSHFTDDGVIYGCLRESDETNRYELDFRRNNSYTDELSGNGGGYKYNRNRGRIDFRSGPVNRFFLKVVMHGGSIYEYKLKRQRNGSTWGSCHPIYPS